MSYMLLNIIENTKRKCQFDYLKMNHENRDCSFLRNSTHIYAEYYVTNFSKSGGHVQV